MRHLPGLDYGRAFFILAVVGWHTQMLGSARVLRLDQAGVRLPVDVVGVLYFNVLLLAVPFFLTASLVLYTRARTEGSARFVPRLKRLAGLASFWVAVWTLSVGIGHIDVGEAARFVLSGNGSVFYFLVELCLLTIVAEAALRCGLPNQPRLTFALVFLAALLPVLRDPLSDAFPSHRDGVLAYWSPLNFVVYPFLAIGVLQLSRRTVTGLRRAWVLSAMLGYIGLAALEWRFMVGHRAFATDATVLSPYARPSVMLAAGAITVLLMKVTREAPRPVRQLSELSLAIYCVHPFLVSNGASVFPAWWATIAPRHWLLFLVVMTVSLSLAYPMRRGMAT